MFLALVLTVIFIATIILAYVFVRKNGPDFGQLLFIGMLVGAFIVGLGVGTYHAWQASHVSITISVSP